ncbi:substrate-binding periplasmic protein [Vibrio atypicus]|jgi:polar amino acid transport system substrate-binding protein|uniref:substrate-binding periplasmic protein n=1 Tax=Vibrio atypicus TaxID=558271 RepID=UPI0013576BE1|nr:transporter substrate-binding domain-containing protein [Vibrio atypicus]
MGILVRWWLKGLIAFFTTSAFAYEPLKQVVIYGDDSYPPYSYHVNGEAKGIYTEILKVVFSQMDGYSIKIKPIPWKRGLKLLELGRGFALYPPYYYADQRFFISPYSEPILDEQVVVFCRQESIQGRKTANWPEDYFGLTIGINEAFSLGGEAFWDAVAQNKIRTLSAKGNELSLIALYEKQSDCYINDKLSVLWALEDLKISRKVPPNWELVETAMVSHEQGYLGFTNVNPLMYPYKSDFVAQFNSHLKRLKQDGTIDKLISDYLSNRH